MWSRAMAAVQGSATTAEELHGVRAPAGVAQVCAPGRPKGWGTPPQHQDVLCLLTALLGGGRSARQVAATVLSRFGDLSQLVRAEPPELLGVPGMTPQHVLAVQAGLALGRRSLREPCTSQAPIQSADDAFTLLGPGLTGLLNEELHALYLDRALRPLSVRCLTRGSACFTVVDVQQIYRPALGLGAHAVVLAHNHPSGTTEPSAQDREVTRRVVKAGRTLGIGLLDHLVVAAGGYRSLAADGVIVGGTLPPSGSWTA